MIDLGMGERVGGVLKAIGTPEYSALEVSETYMRWRHRPTTYCSFFTLQFVRSMCGVCDPLSPLSRARSMSHRSCSRA
jgi:hypothetical protein